MWRNMEHNLFWNPFSLFNEIGSMINISSRFWLSRCDVFSDDFRGKSLRDDPKRNGKQQRRRRAPPSLAFSIYLLFEKTTKMQWKLVQQVLKLCHFFPLIMSHCFGFAFLIYTFFHCLRAASLWATTFLRSPIDCFFQFRSSAEPTTRRPSVRRLVCVIWYECVFAMHNNKWIRWVHILQIIRSFSNWFNIVK